MVDEEVALGQDILGLARVDVESVETLAVVGRLHVGHALDLVVAVVLTQRAGHELEGFAVLLDRLLLESFHLDPLALQVLGQAHFEAASPWNKFVVLTHIPLKVDAVVDGALDVV